MTMIPNRQLFPLLLIIFIDSMGYFIAIPVLVRILSPENALLADSVSETTRNLLFSLALAIMPLAAIISRPIMGHLSDQFGRKKTLAICLVGSGGGFLITALGMSISSFALIVLGRLINGVAASSQAIAQAAITDLTAGKRKAFFLSINALAMTFAMAGGSALGGILSDPALVSWFSDSTPFYAALLLVIVAWFLLIYSFSDTPYLPETTKSISLFSAFRQLLTPAESAQLRWLLIIFFLLELSWSLYYQAAPLSFSEYYGTDATSIGLFMGYAGLWMCIGLGIVYGGLLRFANLPNVLMYCMTTCTLGAVLCGYLADFSGQWWVSIPIVLGVGMGYTTLLTLMSNIADIKQQGILMGLAGATLAFAWLITGSLSGILVNIFPSLPLHASGWLMALAFVLAFTWYKRFANHPR
ncbi:MAG: MFS transporter [Gammaproteobacteria bacterium]